jgi:hypothetical protein
MNQHKTDGQSGRARRPTKNVEALLDHIETGGDRTFPG